MTAETVTALAEVASAPETVLPEDWRYDPKRIETYYSKRWPQVIGRVFALLTPALSFGLSLLFDKLTGSIPRNEQRRAEQLREIVTQLGPAYIKIGQALSSRPDLVPPAYLEELTLLQDQIPPFSNETAFRFIKEELGARPEEIFAELTPKPIAAASLGQVYRGRLKSGEEVAVKVQRPDLAGRIAIDIFILRLLARWVMANVPRVRSNLVAILDEFSERIFEEMNYTHEGQNAERFREFYGYLQEIYIPTIYWEYTGRRVLTMEWITGTKLTNLREIQAQGIDATHLVEVGVECSLRQLLEYGFFHADPHPGNLLAMPDGRLAYLDFGMMSSIKPYQRYGLIQAVVHLVNRDFTSLADDYVQLEFLTPDTNLEPIIPALRTVFGNALGASVAELNFKSITDQMSAIMYEFPFTVPAYYALIIRSLVTLEGIAIGIDPNFKVLSKAYPYIAKRLLVDPAPELRASLRDLLFREDGFRWNRLENLLRNAKNAQDYDFDTILDQGMEFVFSDRGAFIRDRLAGEIVSALDRFGQERFYALTAGLRGLQEQLAGSAAAVHNAPPNDRSEDTFARLQGIFAIVQETKGYDPTKLVAAILRLVVKPETQELGQKVVAGLMQRALARSIRALLAAGSPQPATETMLAAGK